MIEKEQREGTKPGVDDSPMGVFLDTSSQFNHIMWEYE